jgi:NADPH:quinone reductase-like Zn-dependent oxidoreductase
MMSEVFSAIESGKIHPVEPTTFPLDNAVDALRALQSRSIAGKIALIP